VQLISKLG